MANTLTEEDVIILYEIFGISQLPNLTIVLGLNLEMPRDLTSLLLTSGVSNLQYDNPDTIAAGNLALGIANINQTPAKVARVQAIIEEYKRMSLDPIIGEKHRYGQKRFIKNIRVRLYPYVGVLMRDIEGEGNGGRLTIG